MVTLTLGHYIFALIILIVIVLMAMKKDVVIVCVIGAFFVALSFYNGNILKSIQAVFNSILVAGEDLLIIILIISLMIAMLKSLNKMGADYKIFSPLRVLIKTPVMAFFSLGIIMYIAALFFWPTPTTGLVGPMLMPVAIAAGLPPILSAMAINMLGHGMALSGDLVVQGALQLTAKSAGITVPELLPYAALFSLLTGFTAAAAAIFIYRKDIKEFKHSSERSKFHIVPPPEFGKFAILFAILVPISFASIIFSMIKFKIIGGDASALIGGTAALILILATLAHNPKTAFDDVVTHIKDGFLFGMKIFAPVLLIAAFFLMGSGSSVDILGKGAPRYIFDLGSWIADIVPIGRLPLSFGNMIIGIITGLDGSGFSGLPLVGGLAQALGGPYGVKVPVLAAIGQMGAVWSGGGTLVPWAFGLAASAGVANVNPQELARKNLIPVAIGLTITAIVGAILM